MTIKLHAPPYSDSTQTRRNQLIENLQYGLLLENKNLFLSWNTPYSELVQHVQKRYDRGGRDTFYFGECRILNGLTAHVLIDNDAIMPANYPFYYVHDMLGQEQEGYQRFRKRMDYFTGLFGPPGESDLEPCGSVELGSVKWNLGKAQISLVGVEVHSYRYFMYVGLVDEGRKRHDEYLWSK